jgi:3-hydroxyisobutyrate dehydrogenase-like beta-hydroxyacid dehydrogenase
VSEPAARIGFIGLGVMGEAMCRNLLTKGGWPVVAHDLNPEPAAQLASEGAEAAKTPHALAETCDMVILCLPGGEQVRRLVLEDGLIARLRPGAILVDMSTSPPALMREIAAEAAARGVRFADAPVARTRQAAADGTLAIMVGGEADLFAEVHPVLATMGADIVHCRGPGHRDPR